LPSYSSFAPADKFALQIKAMETEILEEKITADQEFDRKFKPKGAIAFFVLLVILGLIIWYGIYFLMLERV